MYLLTEDNFQIHIMHACKTMESFEKENTLGWVLLASTKLSDFGLACI